MKKCLVLGAAGFLGSHLEHRLKKEGHYVVSIARRPPPYRKSVANEFNIFDLTNHPDFHMAHYLRHDFDEVYQMAGEVGGLGYIGSGQNDADILTNSLKINLYTLEAIQKAGNVGKVFFASSQCVYPDHVIEIDPYANERIAKDIATWRESDASFNNFAFGKEKLYAECLYSAFSRNRGLNVRIGRLGNTYGPYCTWDGERAKAVAAICRKVAETSYAGVVSLWGDGMQTRSFTFVDDAIDGILRLMASDYSEPVNIAHPDQVSIIELFEEICEVAGKILGWKTGKDGVVGVKHRGSDNALCKQVLGWEPSISLWEGLEKTYPWVAAQAQRKALTSKAS